MFCAAEDSWGLSWQSCAMWSVNLLVLLMLFVQMFVYGEPAMSTKSKSGVAFFTHCKQAQTNQRKVLHTLCCNQTSFWFFFNK